MKKTFKLFIDQYGTIYTSSTIKELKEKYYLSGKISKIYRDKKDGTVVHYGYCIGQLRLNMYVPLEIKQ